MTPLNVRAFALKEKDELYAHLGGRVSYRVKIVVLAAEGLLAPQIGRALDIHPKTVRKWIKRFNRLGVKGLVKPRDSRNNVKFNGMIRKEICRIALMKPKDLGLPFATWSLRKLREYLIKTKMVESISVWEIRLILVANGISYKRSKEWLSSEDPEYEIKKKRVMELYAKKPENGRVICFDEKGPIAAKEYSGYKWCLESEKVELRQKTFGLTNLFGAYDFHGRKLYRKFYDRKRSVEFIDFFEWLDKEIAGKKYLIMDNAPSHKSKMSTKMLKEHPNLIPVYLPKNSPKLNYIENIFRDVNREVIRNNRFNSKEDVISSINNWIDWKNGKLIGNETFDKVCISNF